MERREVTGLGGAAAKVHLLVGVGPQVLWSQDDAFEHLESRWE